jgi:steroid delta-isomerase-like uncharacterized protein
MDNLQVVRSFYDSLSKPDAKLAASFFDSAGSFNAMDTMSVIQGPDKIQELISGWITAFPDMKLQIKNIFGSGDQVLCEGIVTGTHKGTLSGPQGEIPATGKSIQVPFCDVLKLKNGKINSVNCYFESATMLQQLGAAPVKAAA